jgi:hypothetical protein
LPGLANYKASPALRQAPNQPDGDDPQRISWGRKFWHSQDEALRRRDRQVEENVRMLAGQHWTIWNSWLQKWVDITEWMTDDERRWRQRPVVNRLLYWYMLTHSRLTENLPIVTFQPSTADRLDAMLAEAMDTIFKTVWRDAGMSDVNDLIHAWMVAGGRAYAASRVDPSKGDLIPWVGEARLQLLDQFGRPTGIERTAGPVPFDKNGVPQARLVGDGSAYEVTGKPHQEREGGIVVDVYSPLQCRGEWGPTPWHQKRWHACRTFMTAEAVWDLYQVEVEPDTFADQFETSGELFRVLLGGGYYGSVDGKIGSQFGDARNKEGLCAVDQLWQAPCQSPGMEETEESPGGRLLITTQTKVLRDGVRPAHYRYTSPIRCFDFVRLPGRPSGTTPQEMLNPLNRSFNRGLAQMLEHRNLVSNPIAIADEASGLGDIEPTNRPGQVLVANVRANVEPYRYVIPPPLGADVYKVNEILLSEFKELGNMVGSEGEPPTLDASGELVKELRFNTDRFIGATPKRSVEEYGRMVEDWMAIIPTIWSQEKILNFAGEDSIVRTITVLPEMFKFGRVNVTPDMESMVPEGRGERQKQAIMMYQLGAWGPPGTPPAVAKLLDVCRFPHMNRLARPGGIDRITAEQENGKLLQGQPALTIPVFPFYDSMTHLMVHREYMASPEFLRQPEQIQNEFLLHFQAHEMHLQQQQAQQVQQEAQANAVRTKAQGHAEGEAEAGRAAHAPPEPAASAA